MAIFFSEENSEQAVNARMGANINPRLAQIMSSLVKHLHDFTKEVELTPDEWLYAIEFLTATGKICSAERQEFILLSDTLGLSMLVDAINNRRPESATENTVLGPFYVEGAPIRAMGDNISLDGKGESCCFIGKVLDLEGNPIDKACLDVWSDNAEGFYDVQQPQLQPKWNNRGRFITGPDGSYRFIGIKPVSYPIPDDGPVGKMLAALGRHPYRPAHMHFKVYAPGYNEIITHTFVGDDYYIGDDAVFGVKQTLVAPYEIVDQETKWQSEFNFTMIKS